MKKGLIITGGRLDESFAHEYLLNHSFEEVILVDGALEAAGGLTLSPTQIVGDFDTVSDVTLNRFKRESSAKWVYHVPEKDATDMEMALDSALESGCESVTVLGAFGGRMDHTLANIHLLYKAEQQGVACELLDSQNRVTVLLHDRRLLRKEVFGTYVSLIPLTTEVTGITLKGFKYPLQEYTLAMGTSLGVSNELLEEEGYIGFKAGVLICLETRDEKNECRVGD